MKNVTVFFILISPLFPLVLTQANVAWTTSARFENFTQYFPNLIQEMIYELERRGLWTLTVDEIDIPINQVIYGRNFVGTSKYTNGFVISLQDITIINVQQSFSTSQGSMRARMTFHDVSIGYDVYANFTEYGEHRFTGSYLHPSFFWDMQITQNLATKEITVGFTQQSTGSGTNWMDFKPQSDITEVVSRDYRAATVADSIRRWAYTTFASIILDLIHNKIGFPEICFSC